MAGGKWTRRTIYLVVSEAIDDNGFTSADSVWSAHPTREQAENAVKRRRRKHGFGMVVLNIWPVTLTEKREGK